MNCGKKVRLKPIKIITAAMPAHILGYFLPEIFGHQKWIPPRYPITAPPTMMQWKWATMKYVPLRCTSVASEARNSPVKPPIVKRPMNPKAYSIGASYEIDPLYKVEVQLNTLMADGIATRKLNKEKISPA